MGDDRLIKIFCERKGGKDRRYICWFSLRDADLYWGPGIPGPMAGPMNFEASPSIQITVPENLATQPVDAWKVSHHASGFMHSSSTKRGPVSTDVYVGNVLQAAAPKLIAAHISRPLSDLMVYTRSPNRGEAKTIRFMIPDELWTRRFYFEFYHTPAGSFDWPNPLLKMRGPTAVDPFEFASLTLAKDDGTGKADIDLILAVRCCPMGEDLSTWRTDAGIWLQALPPSKGNSISEWQI
jgi:hypothetical protein